MATVPSYDLTSGERLELKYLRQQESLRRQDLHPTQGTNRTIYGQPYYANQFPNRVESIQPAFTNTNYGQRPPRNLVYAYQRPIQSQLNRDSRSFHHLYHENTTAHVGRSFQAVQPGYMPRLDESSTHHPRLATYADLATSMGRPQSLLQTHHVSGRDRNIIDREQAVTSIPLRCSNCGIYSRAGIPWVNSTLFPGKILCYECGLHEGGYQNMRQQSALPPNAARSFPYSLADETLLKPNEMLLPTSSQGAESSPCPPRVKDQAYIPPSIPKPDDRNYSSPHGAKVKVFETLGTILNPPAQMPLSQVQPPLHHRDGMSIFYEPKAPFSRSNYHVPMTPVSDDRKPNMGPQAGIRLPSLKFSTSPSALSNPVTPTTITRGAAHTSSPLGFQSSSAIPSSISEEPRPPIRQDAKSPPHAVRPGTRATTRLKLVDLLNANGKIKAESPVPSNAHTHTPKVPKKKVRAEDIGSALNGFGKDLAKIWSADPRVPTAASRKVWARARGIAYGSVFRWFYNRRAKALKLGDVIGEGSYELQPDAPEPKEVVIKQEVSETSEQIEKVVPDKSNVSKVPVKLEKTDFKNFVGGDFNDPPALSTRSKSSKSQKVQALDTRTSATHPTHFTATNSSPVASSLSIDSIPSRRKRKLDLTESSAAIVSSPPPKSNKKRKTCASKSAPVCKISQNDARQPASESKVIPKTNPPRSVKATRNVSLKPIQKSPAAPNATPSAAPATKNASLEMSNEQVNVDRSAELVVKSIKPNPGVKTSASSLFTDILEAQPPQTFEGEIIPGKELARYSNADIKFVPISEHWEDLSYISLLQKWETTALTKCLSNPPTSDAKWRASLSKQMLRDERLLPMVDESWNIEDMEFTPQQLKEIAELNEEMRVCSE